MESNKPTAMFCIFVGILNIITWIILIILSEVPNVESEIVAYIFHWTSEFTMAGLNVIAGILILRDSELKTRLYYFAEGMLLIAVIGMVVYYIIDFEIIFIVMGIVITALTIIFCVKNRKSLVDFLYLTLGAIIYVQLNTLGNTLINNDLATFTYTIMSFILTFLLIIVLFKKKAEIE